SWGSARSSNGGSLGVEEAGRRGDREASGLDVDLGYDLGDERDEHLVPASVLHMQQILRDAVGDVDDLTDERVVLIDLQTDEVVEVPGVGIFVLLVLLGEDESIADLLGAVAIG